MAMPLTASIILEGLNAAQQQAVLTIDRPLLVVAGPGTGKTLTLVRRVAYLVHRGVRPEGILAVTFTNRAGREMKERAEELLGDHASKIFIGTFHLLGLRIIRERLGSGFTVLGREEQAGVLKTIVKGPAKKMLDIAERISLVKNDIEPPDAGLGEVLALYQSALQQRGAFDFDDLIRVPIELLQDEAVARDYRDRFKHLMVDEYQDINPAQYRLVRLLAGATGTLCVVGDSDQAIYSFRGADLGNFLNFEQDIPAAGRVTLTKNYRSSGVILSAADSVIRNNQKRISKDLTATSDAGVPVSVLSVPDDRAEGAVIIHEIEARMGGTSHERQTNAAIDRSATGRTHRFSDFGVIYRTNAQARLLEEAFAASGIPYQVIGKRGSNQRQETEEMIAFLKSLAYPGAGDNNEAQHDPNAAEAMLLTEADFFDPRADAVTLMTMHMAKGLEFRCVFIAGCEDGLVPFTIRKDGSDIEEERRLFYVGMTRAKEELFLIHARSRFLFGKGLGPRTSPFLEEIPEDLKVSRVIADKRRKQKPEDRQMGLF